MSDLAELILNVATQEWLRDAACADREASDFFVEAGHTIKPEVLNVCRGCPVRVQCLRYAYRRGIDNGYFGGMSPGQRRKMTIEEALEYIANDPVRPLSPEPSRRRRR